jgi:DNA polymerase III epsilon subunit-like protein
MIVVDVETTGLDPKRHSIVSIGAIDFFNPANQFYQECRIFEGAEITPEALAINGFSEEEIKNPNKKTLEEIVKDFFKLAESLEDRTIAGENPEFDKGFLKASAERCGIEWRFGSRTVDLHAVAYAHQLKRGFTPALKNGKSDQNLDKTLCYVGLPEEPKPHNGLVGAKMEAEAFSRLIYGKSLLKEFEKFPIPDYF